MRTSFVVAVALGLMLLGPTQGARAADYLISTQTGVQLVRGATDVGSHCDDNPYHGWVLAYDPATLRLKSAFNTAPSGVQGAIWQSGVGLSANANGIFFSVGNGTWSEDGKALGLSVVRLNADNTLADPPSSPFPS